MASEAPSGENGRARGLEMESNGREGAAGGRADAIETDPLMLRTEKTTTNSTVTKAPAPIR